MKGKFLLRNHIQKHKLTIRGSLPNKFSSNVHIWTNYLTSDLKTTNQLSIHLCEWILSLMKQPHVNKNIKKPMFQKFLSSSTCAIFLYFFEVNLPFPIYSCSDDLIGLRFTWNFESVLGTLRTDNKNFCDKILFSEKKIMK